MYLYLLTDGSRYKIGITKDVDRRLKQLQTGAASPLFVITVSADLPPTKARFLERELHRSLRSQRTSGEWFDLDARLLSVVKAEIGVMTGK